MRLTDNDIKDEGARMIGEALKINSTLIDLNLCCDRKKKEENKGRKMKYEMN